MWDPKPDGPAEIRGPFGHIPTKRPGVHVCEHLPLTAQIMDRLTIIRSVDCSASDHTPITMQAGHPLARRTNDGRDGGGYPSMGSVVSKFRGPIDPTLPAFVGDSTPSTHRSTRARRWVSSTTTRGSPWRWWSRARPDGRSKSIRKTPAS